MLRQVIVVNLIRKRFGSLNDILNRNLYNLKVSKNVQNNLYKLFYQEFQFALNQDKKKCLCLNKSQNTSKIGKPYF